MTLYLFLYINYLIAISYSEKLGSSMHKIVAYICPQSTKLYLKTKCIFVVLSSKTTLLVLTKIWRYPKMLKVSSSNDVKNTYQVLNPICDLWLPHLVRIFSQSYRFTDADFSVSWGRCTKNEIYSDQGTPI